jgi:TldD protein
VPFEAKVRLLEQIDAAARARDPRVAQVSASLAGSWSVVEIVRADGFVAHDVRPLVRLNVSIVAEQDGRRETGSFGIGGRRLYDDLFAPETWNRAIDSALAQALTNLGSVAAPAGEMTVLLGPGWPACCCTKRSATASKAISTARAPAPFPAASASAWPRPA